MSHKDDARNAMKVDYHEALLACLDGEPTSGARNAMSPDTAYKALRRLTGYDAGHDSGRWREWFASQRPVGARPAYKYHKGIYQDGPIRIGNVAFREYSFRDCVIRAATPRTRMTDFDRVAAVDCQFVGCAVRQASFNQCDFSNCQGQTIDLEGCIFNETVLRGRFQRVRVVMFERTLGSPPVEVLDGLNNVVRTKYANVSWALDLRDADIDDSDFRGVPPRLVKRNERNSAVLSRTKYQRFKASGGVLARSAIRGFFTGMIDDDEVLIVASENTDAGRKMIHMMEEWKRVGIAT